MEGILLFFLKAIRSLFPKFLIDKALIFLIILIDLKNQYTFKLPNRSPLIVLLAKNEIGFLQKSFAPPKEDHREEGPKECFFEHGYLLGWAHGRQY